VFDKTNTGFKVNNFDLLRLLAATEVVCDHYFEHFHHLTNPLALKLLYLFPGVPVFFIISGYLVSASYERNRDLWVYFKNRALRIFPGLWACILVTIVVFSITGINFFNKQTLTWVPSQLMGIIYTPGFLSHYGIGSYNGSLWTITVELQFYVLLPLGYWLVPKNKVNFLLYGLLILFIVLNLVSCFYFPHNAFKGLWRTFVPYIYLFLIGVMLQRLRLYSSPWIRNKALYWIAFYVPFNLILSSYIDPPFFSIIYGIVLAFCVLSTASTLPDTALRLLRSNDISYGIYIYHGLIITIITQWGLTADVDLPLLLMLSYFMAYLSWIYIERPFIRMKEKTIRYNSSVPAEKKYHSIFKLIFRHSKNLLQSPKLIDE
jgi:peptidoglycan/LPS O-acetylase OafA/YrhL